MTGISRLDSAVQAKVGGKSLGMVCMQHMYRRRTEAAERCEVTVKVMYGRRSRHPGASRVTCQRCQVLNLNSREGYSYPGIFQQRFNGNNLSIPFVLCLKGEANKEGAARVEMPLKFCHASQRQERNNRRKKTAFAQVKNDIATKTLTLQSTLKKLPPLTRLKEWWQTDTGPWTISSFSWVPQFGDKSSRFSSRWQKAVIRILHSVDSAVSLKTCLKVLA